MDSWEPEYNMKNIDISKIKFTKVTNDTYDIIYSYHSKCDKIQYDMSFFWLIGVNSYFYSIYEDILIIKKVKNMFGRTIEYLLHKPLNKDGTYNEELYLAFKHSGMDCRDFKENISKDDKSTSVTGNSIIGGDIIYQYTNDDLKLSGKKYNKYRYALKNIHPDITSKMYQLNEDICVDKLLEFIEKYKNLKPKSTFHLKTYIKQLPTNINGFIHIIFYKDNIIGFSICEKMRDNYYIIIDRKHLYREIDNKVDFNMYIQYMDFKYILENVDEVTFNIGFMGTNKNLFDTKIKLRNYRQQHISIIRNSI